MIIRTNGHGSFFGEGLVAHISVADPFCADLADQLESAVRLAGGVVHRGGSFITIEGPRFSTKAEFQHLSFLGHVHHRYDRFAGSLPGP